MIENYAERVPLSLGRENTNGPNNYVPHSGVNHLKKPDKFSQKRNCFSDRY